ncbi:MAG: undecaprenyl-diphosphate phosphatase [Actinomycetaceae bacterium]|nr:undecaprenyl-diphosphate phosphatase [Actinomycetaceae bacterium]
MGIIEAIVLGIVQGLTEFLPISSSAHIRIISDLLGWGDAGASFTAVIQIGTEAAVIVYFAKDIWRIISRWFRAIPWFSWKNPVEQSDPDVRLGWTVIIGTLPIGILGLLFDDVIEKNLRNIYIVAFVLGIFAVFLALADSYSVRMKKLEEITLKDGFLYGLGQAMALIPGVSRSGGTITVGLLLGYTREAAARMSFLMAIPAVLMSGLYEFVKYVGTGNLPLIPTFVGVIVSFVVGYFVIVWFLKLVSSKTYMGFVYYRIIVAIIVVVLAAAGLISVTASA